MRKIAKNLHGECANILSELIENYSADKGDPYKQYLSPQQRQALRSLLLAEQNGLCVYCEKVIEEDNCHIEHIRPQNSANSHNLVEYLACKIGYENLVVSCEKEPNKNSTCGHRRGEVNLKQLKFLINPVTENVTDYLRFNLTGNIVPVNELKAHQLSRASYTIEHLDLNSKLVDANYVKNLLPQARLNAKAALTKLMLEMIQKHGKERTIQMIKKVLYQFGFVSFVYWSFPDIFQK